jgi:CDP-4-dehydro-6-deoxyglucose reductase, E1
MKNYPLATSTWDDLEIEAIQSVIDSGMFTMGPRVQAFEQQFAAYVGSRYCVMLNSGSSANLLATAALFFRKQNALMPGDEVIVPAVSWPTTYYPLSQYGLLLKFVDIDLETLNYDLKALEAALTSKTRLVVAVNLLGNPNDFSAIDRMLQGRDIVLLEDNCESLGANLNGKQTGTFGVMGTFSTFFSHHISTMEGGLVATDDEELYHILLSLRAHGWTRSLPKVNHVTGTKSDDPFEESFKFVLPGYNVRPLEMSGAIGVEQLKKLPQFLLHRRRNADTFTQLFSNSPFFHIQREIGESSWFGFSLILKEDAPFSRERMVEKLHEAGVDCRPIVAGNFAKNEVVKRMPHEISGTLANAELLDRNGFFVGNHHYDLNEQLQGLHRLLHS